MLLLMIVSMISFSPEDPVAGKYFNVFLKDVNVNSPRVVTLIYLPESTYVDVFPMESTEDGYVAKIRVPKDAFYLKFYIEDTLNFSTTHTEGLYEKKVFLKNGRLNGLAYYFKFLETPPSNIPETEPQLFSFFLYKLKQGNLDKDLLSRIVKKFPASKYWASVIDNWISMDPASFIDNAETLIDGLKGYALFYASSNYILYLMRKNPDKAHSIYEKVLPEFKKGTYESKMFQYIGIQFQPDSKWSEYALDLYARKEFRNFEPLLMFLVGNNVGKRNFEDALNFYKKWEKIGEYNPDFMNHFAYMYLISGGEPQVSYEIMNKVIKNFDFSYIEKKFFQMDIEDKKNMYYASLANYYDTRAWALHLDGKDRKAMEDMNSVLTLLDKTGYKPDKEVLVHYYEISKSLHDTTGMLSVLPSLAVMDKEEYYEPWKELMLAHGYSAEQIDSLYSARKWEEVSKNMIDEEAIDFELPDLEGKKFSLKENRGRVIAINFWATWCGPCRREIPHLNQLVEKWKNNKDVLFVAISNEDKDTIEKFLKNNKFDYRILQDEKGVGRDYGVTAIPTHVIIGKDGRIKFKHVGFKEGLVEEMNREIEYLLR